MRALFGLREINSPRLEGSYILAPNHTSFIDPLVVQLTHRRHVTFLMDGPIFRQPAMNWFFRFWGAIPIPAARVVAGALKSALKTIRSGEVVAIFPEGRISPDGSLKDGKAGVAMLMLKARVPVVPVAIFGTRGVLPRWARFPRPGRVLVVYGEPIPPTLDPEDKKDAARELAAQVMESISGLQARFAKRA